MILSYEINNIKISQFPELNNIKDTLWDKDRLWDYKKTQQYLHKQVYVTLKEANGVYIIESIGFQKPENKLYLAGKINYFF